MIDLLTRGIDLPREDRDDFCRRECEDDPGLLVDLMSLLETHDRGLDGFLERPLEFRLRRPPP